MLVSFLYPSSVIFSEKSDDQLKLQEDYMQDDFQNAKQILCSLEYSGSFSPRFESNLLKLSNSSLKTPRLYPNLLLFCPF